MRIRDDTGDRLVLAGTPGGRIWMIALVAIGGAITAAAAGFAVAEYRQGGGGAPLVPLVAGILIGQALFWTGAVTLVVGREQLELDHVTGRGRYEVRSPIVETDSRPFEFDVSNLDRVTIETYVEHARGRRASARSSERIRTRLLVRSPRRAVTLLDRMAGGADDVERMAERVAGFVEVAIDDRRGGG